MLSTRDPPQNRGHIQTESEGLGKDIPCKQRLKEAGVAILISDKIDFKIKHMKKDKEEQYIMITGSIQEEHNKIFKYYTPKITEAEDIKKRWQEYMEELYKKDPHDPGNHDGVLTHLEPDILECEVKWALESIAMNRASGGDGIPAELFQS